MRLVLDPAKCDGFGFCAELLPEMVSLDEWGFPIIADAEIPESLLRGARQALKLCPRRALFWTEPITLAPSRCRDESGTSRSSRGRPIASALAGGVNR